MSSLLNQKNLLRRLAVMFLSVPLFGLAIAFYVKGMLGGDAIITFQLGVARVTGLTLGTVSLLMNVSILVFFLFFDRKLIGPGSFLFAFTIGPAIDFFSRLLNSNSGVKPPLPLALLYVALGIVLLAVGIANYLKLELGTQSMDMAVLAMSKGFHISVGKAMIAFQGVLFVIGVLLGGAWGVGTLMGTFLLGPVVDLLLPAVSRFSRRLAGMPPESPQEKAAA